MGVGEDKGKERDIGLHCLQPCHVLSYGFWKMDCRTMGQVQRASDNECNGDCGQVPICKEEERKEGDITGDKVIKKGEAFQLPQKKF